MRIEVSSTIRKKGQNHVKRSLLSSCVLVFFALAQWLGSTEASAPFLFTSFQPASDTILARSTIGTLTEQEFCIYLLLGTEIAHDLYMRYRTEQNPEKKAVLEQNIRSAIEDYFVIHALAQQAQAVQPPSATEQRPLRMQKYPIYEWVWVDRYLRNTFTVRSEDIKKYYNKHREGFLRPEEMTVHYVFLAVPEEIAGFGREDARRQLEGIRDSVSAGKDFAVTAQKTLPDIQVSTCTLQEGTRSARFPETFQLEAFKLQPDELSPVFETADGAYLVECVERRKETPIPLEQVADQIRNRLTPQILAYQYQYEINKLRKRSHPKNRARWLRELKDDSPVIQVGRFTLTKADLIAEHPACGENATALELKQAVEVCEDLINKELIAQACERLELDTDRRLEFADTVCRAMLAAVRARETYVASKMTITPEQERTYFQQNPDLFRVEPSYTIFRITGTLNDTQQHSAKVTDQEKKQIRSKLKECMEAIKNRWDTIASEHITTTQPTHPERRTRINLTVGTINELLEQHSTKAITFHCEQLRYVPTRETSPLDSWLRNVDQGKFSPIGETENKVFVFFVAGYDQARQLDFDSIRHAIHTLLVHSARKEALTTLRTTTLEYLKIHYTF